MGKRNRKVIGYFAFSSPANVVCTGEAGNACLIAGSVGTMKGYLTEFDPDRSEKHTIKKTTFEEILNGLKMGAAYAFDERSYKIFYPLARKEGLPVSETNFSEKKSEGLRFFTVQLTIL